MEGTGGGRSGRRNDSISSVMSFTAEGGSTWNRQNDDHSAAPTTPRDTQKSSRAGSVSQYHALNATGAEHAPLSPESCTSDSMDPLSPNSLDTNEATVPMSDMDFRKVLFEMLEQLPETAAEDYVTIYQLASQLPPITQDSLGELDVARIIGNPKLRHDVNFDRELHFRPNLDGSRGKKKAREADMYWEALFAELVLYTAIGKKLMESQSAEEQQYWARMMQVNQVRIPGMFETIKEVLKTLVPERDQPMIAERLDIPMIMQQLSKGVFNLVDLTEWLATLLKAHCAPMRDEWIEQMVQQTAKGVEMRNASEIVRGFKQALAILEAMKLDVANHQIRHLRSLLIDDTVNFQQKYHVHKINCGRMDITRARMWYQREETYLHGSNSTATALDVFTSAVIRSLLSQSPMNQFPETFHLDQERLRIMRSDLHHLLQLDMCYEAFDMLTRDKFNEHTRSQAKGSLKSTITDIVGEKHHYLVNAGNIAAEIVRLVLQIEGSDADYDNDMIDMLERQLKANFELSSPAFGTRLNAMLEEQFPRLCNAVQTASRLPLVILHDTMLPPIQTPSKRVLQDVQAIQEPPVDEILKRVTHVAVLHWHIWGSMVYILPVDGSMSGAGPVGPASDGSQINATAPDARSSTPETQAGSGSINNQQSGSSLSG